MKKGQSGTWTRSRRYLIERSQVAVSVTPLQIKNNLPLSFLKLQLLKLDCLSKPPLLCNMYTREEIEFVKTDQGAIEVTACITPSLLIYLLATDSPKELRLKWYRNRTANTKFCRGASSRCKKHTLLSSLPSCYYASSSLHGIFTVAERRGGDVTVAEEVLLDDKVLTKRITIWPALPCSGSIHWTLISKTCLGPGRRIGTFKAELWRE